MRAFGDVLQRDSALLVSLIVADDLSSGKTKTFAPRCSRKPGTWTCSPLSTHGCEC